MLWKVILADDEYFIRQRIKKSIPWEELGLTFAGEAKNSQETLTLLSEELADILILDIEMPKLGGMDVANYIHHHYPRTKIIILSGYSDFEYTRSTISCSVSDYLSKPVNPKDLTNTLLSCIASLEKEQEQQNLQEKFVHYEKSMILSQVLNGSLPFEKLIDKYPDFSSFSYCLYIGTYFYENGSLILQELSALLGEKGIYHVTFQESDTRYMIQVFQKSPDAIRELPALLWKFLYQHGVSFFYLGSPFPVTEAWKVYYKKISHGILLRYFTKLPELLEEQSCMVPAHSGIDFQSIRQTITNIFNKQNEDAFKDYIHLLFYKLKHAANTEHLYLTVSELFLSYALYMEGFQALTFAVSGLAHSILDEGFSLEELEHMLISSGYTCLHHENASPAEIMVSKKVITHIEQNYQNSDLTVTQLADLLQMNASYMGSLFKKVNNQSILQYITSVRMEQAKKLLECNQYRIFEVAEMVGYVDVFYFSRRFKKSYGCSPKEYAAMF